MSYDSTPEEIEWAKEWFKKEKERRVSDAENAIHTILHNLSKDERTELHRRLILRRAFLKTLPLP
jgi:hypothetical protein